MSSQLHSLSALQSACTQALKAGTGKVVMPAPPDSAATLSSSSHRILVRVGLLGPAFGGHCVIDVPLLTALNLSAASICGKNFTTLNDDSPEHETFRRALVGVPYEGSKQICRCMDAWVKTIDVNLGVLENNAKMNVAIAPATSQYPYGIIRVKIGENEATNYKLDSDKRAVVQLKERKALVAVIDKDTIEVDFDEAYLTLGSVPSVVTENNIITTIDGKQHMIKSASSLVKSRLLELANQVAPYTIPSDLIGDISTPELIPMKLRNLPLPNMEKLEVSLIVMGIGVVSLYVELCPMSHLNPRQVDVFKRLFNYTFYHPDLKKIFG